MRINQVTVGTTDVARAEHFYSTLCLRLIVRGDHSQRFECPEGDSTFSAGGPAHGPRRARPAPVPGRGLPNASALAVGLTGAGAADLSDAPEVARLERSSREEPAMELWELVARSPGARFAVEG